MTQEVWSNNNNMTKLCRLCLVTNNTLTSMFTFSSRLGILIADAVLKCTTIHVIEEDDLPDSICGACYMELERINQFQTMAIESDKALRTRKQQQQTEIQRFDKMASEITVKSEDIVENKNSCQLNVKEENPRDSSEDVKNLSSEEIFKVESEVVIKEEPINDTGIDTNNEESIIDEVAFDFLEPADNSYSEQMESSVPQFDIIEPYNEYQENKNMLKRNQCHVCKEFFNGRYQLRKHKLTHPRKSQRFPCDQCKRVFKQRNQLVFHRFSHEKEQNCDMCEKKFRSRHILNAHKLTHTGEKPYRCMLCRKTFKGQISLKNHMLWHTGDKPHWCRICENQFRHYYNLRLHLSLVHGTENI